MQYDRYPVLEIDLKKLETNAENIRRHCDAHGIKLCAVVKGFMALPEMVDTVIRAGCDQIGTSRLSQIRSMRERGVKGPFMLLRIPQLCEIAECAEIADYSLHSEVRALDALNDACRKIGRKHKAVIMFDLGDLREGFWDEEEGISAAVHVEKDLDWLELAGVGVNLGCYGTIRPTVEKMNALIDIARRVEAKIGRRLEIVSGGATTSYGLVDRDIMPAGINHLRIGEEISCGADVPYLDGSYVPDDISNTVLTFKAQICELKRKPTRPVGEFFRDAFRLTPDFPDRGNRMRAIAAFGRADIADFSYLERGPEGITILGGSSDHALLDVEDYKGELKVGDVLSWHPTYAGQLFLCFAPDVKIVYKK